MRIINSIKRRFYRIYNKFGGGNNIKGISLLRRFRSVVIDGTGNVIEIHSPISNDVHIMIYGNNHKLIIEEEVIFKNGQIWFEDHGCEIRIGSGTTIEEANLAVAENSTKLIIGKDCMFSRGINIVTTDSHSIISLETRERTNPAKDVIIGNHVWLGNGVSINKGVTIGFDAIVAGHSIVTKSISSNCIAAGVPAKVVKTGVTWNRVRV